MPALVTDPNLLPAADDVRALAELNAVRRVIGAHAEPALARVTALSRTARTPPPPVVPAPPLRPTVRPRFLGG